MNLVASLVVRNELGRYLDLCIEHLLAFCDKVVVLDDASDDGTTDYLLGLLPNERLNVSVRAPGEGPGFFEHEGRTRQTLLDLTLNAKPTHVLSIDADEFVSDGAALRARVGADPDVAVWALEMREVWTADASALRVREDGGWRPHPVGLVWRPPATLDSHWRIMDRKLACRRVPVAVWRSAARPTGIDLLHFGWTDPATRAARLARYRKHDGGRFHARSHLDSAEWDDDDPRLRLSEHAWPEGSVFDRLRERFAATVAV